MAAKNLSPCMGLCRLDDDDFCVGCRRHLDEIRDWGLKAEDEQRKILSLLAARRAASPENEASVDEALMGNCND